MDFRISCRPLCISVCVAIFFAIEFGLLIECLKATSGTFVYALDDPYIHLALAERLVTAHYGLNAGEIAAPSSSILWPFLLTIGVGTPWHQYLPFAICVAAGAATTALIAWMVCGWPIFSGTPYSNLKRIGLVVALMFAANLLLMPFSGMEHSLQLLIVVVCAYAINEALFGRNIPVWCLAVAALGPAVRYEMIGPVVAVGIALWVSGRARAALALVLSSLIVPFGFGLYLKSQGLAFLPNSVLAKSGQLSRARTRAISRAASEYPFFTICVIPIVLRSAF